MTALQHTYFWSPALPTYMQGFTSFRSMHGLYLGPQSWTVRAVPRCRPRRERLFPGGLLPPRGWASPFLPYLPRAAQSDFGPHIINPPRAGFWSILVPNFIDAVYLAGLRKQRWALIRVTLSTTSYRLRSHALFSITFYRINWQA
jgi:hypothetical protein